MIGVCVLEAAQLRAECLRHFYHNMRLQKDNMCVLVSVSVQIKARSLLEKVRESTQEFTTPGRREAENACTRTAHKRRELKYFTYGNLCWPGCDV